MKPFALSLLAPLAVISMTGAPAFAGPASGTVKSPTGTISPTQAIAYVVRDSRNGRNTRIEVMLTDVAVNAAGLQGDLDPHATAINFRELNDRDYVLVWITPPSTVSMNATYSKTMTQYLNDTSGGLKAELTTNTATKVAGRLFSPSPLKTVDGSTYTVDVKFSADVIPGLSGSPLPAGGGNPAKALMAFFTAIKAKNWNGIKAGLSPNILPGYERSYNTAQENLDSAVDILSARLELQNAKVAGGLLINPTTAVLDVEGERFGRRSLSLVKMVKTGAAWQYEESVPAGALR